MSRPLDILREFSAATPDGVISMPVAVRALLPLVQGGPATANAEVALRQVHNLLAWFDRVGGIDARSDEGAALSAEDLALCPAGVNGPITSFVLTGSTLAQKGIES